MKTRILLNLFMVVSLAGIGFQAEANKPGNKDFKLYLRSGEFTPLKGSIDAALTDVSASETYGGRIYRVLQFNEVPNEQARIMLSQAQVVLTEYIPTYAWIASMPAGINPALLLNSGVRAVIKLSAEQKLTADLLSTDLPIWAMRGSNMIELQVSLQKDIPVTTAIRVIQDLGYEVTSRISNSTFITVNCPVTKLKDFANLPLVVSVDAITAPSTPDDTEGRSLHRSNAINSDYAAGRHYDGTGVTIALADDGTIDPHIDFTGRLTQWLTSNSGNHGDMTSGICAGAGNLNPRIRGMATGANLHVYSITGYPQVVNAVSNYNVSGTVISSTSYSQGTGGVYTTDSEFIDGQIYQNPQLIHVFSAGNAGTSTASSGYPATWGNITGGYKASKNIITCANLNNKDALENSSSRGPAADGRIKPDISANGINQLSTDAPNGFQVGGGTSAACPGVAGVTGQIYHAYKTLNGGVNPETPLIKACILNGADDLGNAGPDFKHGWGRINGLNAVRTLEDGRYFSDVISNGATNTHPIIVPANVAQVKVMVYWLDYQGSSIASKALVNDINITLQEPGGGVTYNPWRLDHSQNATALNTPAVRGIDDRNNMEQVTIDLPTAGTYMLSVNGFLIPQGPQKYYVVYEFRTTDIEVTYPIGGEGFVPGEQEIIRWDTHGNTSNFSIDYSTNGGTSWTSIVSSVAASQRYFTWTVPSTVSGQTKVRVNRGSVSGQSGENFTIAPLPTAIVVDWACPDSIKLSWTGSASATGYEVYQLGVKYMDPVGTTTNNFLVIPNTNPTNTYWFSVATLTANNGKGRRANAIQKLPGTFGCPLAVDASLQAVSSPSSGTYQDCQSLNAVAVKVTIENKGINPLTNVPVSFRINGGAVSNETYLGTINPNSSIVHTFATTANIATPGNYTIEAWVNYPGDGNSFNDTSSSGINVISGILAAMPASQTFEAQTFCSTATDCEITLCPLTIGWINVPNGGGDDIDWRVDAGGTPSANTGPTVDHTLGTAAGKYIYLESSGGCLGKTASLISPCIDLSGSTSPQLRFWYHLYGAAMGSLHVDIFANGTWNEDITSAISGNVGNNWLQKTVSLTPYIGQIVNIRLRGITGTDFTSDIALDDIQILETAAPPVAAFSASQTGICSGSTVTFNDLSLNSPVSWSWTFNPATVTFAGGTSATSQNPQVTFNSAGNYDVTLTATNSFGNNTSTQVGYISVDQAAIIPITENFQSATFPPTNWSVVSAGAAFTWTNSTSVTGSSGAATVAAYVNNFAYNAPLNEDYLRTLSFDLTSITSSYMFFDVAYARYSATLFESMRIDISTDCGVTWQPTGYLKSGTDLATVADQTASWFPGASGEWRSDTVDLSAWTGNKVIVRFVNINGYGNNIFVDNVNIVSGIVSLNEIQSNELDLVSVYPNPSNGSWSFTASSDANSELSLRVFDMNGRIILSKVYGSGNRIVSDKINMEGYGQGVYYLDLRSGSKASRVKIVVLK